MTTTSAISNAIDYALAQTERTGVMGQFNPPLPIKSPETQFSYKFKSNKNTSMGVFNTTCVYATRQPDETLGLLAAAIQHTAPDGHIIMAQDNAHGAGGLEKRLKQGFSQIATLTKFKCRIWILKKQDASPEKVSEWAKNAAIQPVMNGTYQSAPGLFSWDKVDTASRLLAEDLPQLSGTVADFGCGYGYLSTALITHPNINTLYSVDLDARAVDCCAQNVAARNPHFTHHAMQADITRFAAPVLFDVIVMNPPFHTQTDEDRTLGQQFCETALKSLKKGGSLYLVANRHLPYEAVLKAHARSVNLLLDKSGFKILHAQI